MITVWVALSLLVIVGIHFIFDAPLPPSSRQPPGTRYDWVVYHSHAPLEYVVFAKWAGNAWLLAAALIPAVAVNAVWLPISLCAAAGATILDRLAPWPGDA